MNHVLTTPATASPTPDHISAGIRLVAVERGLDADHADRQRQQQRLPTGVRSPWRAPRRRPGRADRGQADRHERPAGEHDGEDDQGDNDLTGAGAERGQTERHGDHRLTVAARAPQGAPARHHVTVAAATSARRPSPNDVSMLAPSASPTTANAT